MPFQKGVATPGAGRKGYEAEAKQLNKMRRLLDRDLAISERLQNAKELSSIDKEKLAILQARVLKYADKLHATKTETELSNPDGNLKSIIINKSGEQYSNNKSPSKAD